MLTRHWVLESLAGRVENFERLYRLVQRLADEQGMRASREEVRVVLEHLVRRGDVEACQWLGEDQRFEPTIFVPESIHFYWFRTGPGRNVDRGAKQEKARA